jgi:hypothetical protein
VKLVDHTCTLVEPSPDGSATRADAFARGKRELAALQAWYTRDKTTLFTRVPAMRKCEQASTLELFTDVTAYAACTAAPAASMGEALAEISADLAP